MFRGTCDAPGDDGAGGGYAHVTGAAPLQAIGTIQRATGLVTVIGASGVVAQVKVGDPVYRHDTIETGADGAVGITFTDGTAFNLSNNARMALNEFVCDGTSNSALFSLSKGVFAFIAGKVAKAGGLRIDTPFARIRGAAQDGGIGILTLAALAFSTIREIQAASRSDAFLDDGTITYKDLPHGTFEITTRDGRVIVADDPGETVVVDPAGSVTRIPNSSSRMAELQQAQQNALSTLSLGLGQQGAAPGGSSTDTFNVPLQLQPINFSQPQNNDPGPTHVTINITPTTQGFIEIPQSKPPSAPAPAPPPPPESTIAINTIAGDIAIAGVNIINAGKANAGFDITGTTSGLANGHTVTLTILDSSGQVKDTYTTMAANNVWSVNVSSPDARSLADGSYTVTAIVSDAPGNGLVQATQMFVVHETLPTVTISALAADGDNVINHAEAQAGVTLSGSVAGLAAGATFAISVADGSFTHSYTATVNAQGTGWTATIPPTDATTLKDGTLTVTAQVTDQFGNESVQATQTFTVHELPTVTISAQDGDGDNVIIHAEAQGGVTLSGSVTGLAAGTTFNITVADGSFTHSYTATVNAQGTGWTATIPPTDATTLKDGTLTVTAQVTDQFGNQSEQATQGFAVDETLPTVTINGISPDTGSSASDGITNVAVVTVSGTTKANSTVKLFDDGNQAGTVIADSTGHWSVTNVALSEGVNDLTATATDAAGNVSTVSASFVATLDQDTGEHLPVNFNGLTGGYAVEDQTITAVVIDTDNDVPTSGITYTWQISHDGGNTWSTVGANTPTYTPGEDDEGGLLKVLASFTDAAGNTESGSSTVGVLPLLTIANNSLLVSTNGSVSLGISLTQEPIPDDTISVTISFPSSGAHDPTVAAGDHATGNPHTSGGITTYTFSVADVNSGLTFTHHGDPVDTLTVQEILNGDIIATSQTMMVTDPPVSGGGVTVSEQPASATGEHTPVQSTSANNHVIVGSPLTEMLSGNGDSSTFLFKTDLDHITDPEINFAQNNANTLLHLPARLDDTGVHTVTDGAHRSHPHFDVTQLASFKVADDGSTHPIQQSTPADDDRHAPEINSASNAKNHLLQLDDDGTMTGGAHPAHPHSDVTQLANFKFADNGSAHPGTVVPHDSPILTALLSDSNGTHEPAAPDLAKTFSVPGTVMSDGASDKFIFPENVDHDMVAGHKPDMTELDHTAPAHIQHLLDAAHDTNAVSTLDPNHATAPQDMTTVQLPHHHGDFHFA